MGGEIIGPRLRQTVTVIKKKTNLFMIDNKSALFAAK